MARAIVYALILLPLAAPASASDPGTLQKKPGFRDAVTAPLADVNLTPTAIPPVLTRAVADPYAMAGLNRCEGIAAEIGRIDAALGPDVDEAPPPDRRSRAEKLGEAAKDATVGEVRDRSRSLVPFRVWVRKLSGAEKHDKALAAAVEAGRVRRGYLKGVGMQRNCAPPAAPSWFVPKVETPAAEPTLWARILAWFRSWWPFDRT